MFVLFENAIQVGDWVTVAGLSGKIERLSARTIWLRGGDGALQIVPFSSVGTITNANRGLGTAAVSVTIAYGEDSDRTADAMRASPRRCGRSRNTPTRLWMSCSSGWIRCGRWG